MAGFRKVPPPSVTQEEENARTEEESVSKKKSESGGRANAPAGLKMDLFNYQEIFRQQMISKTKPKTHLSLKPAVTNDTSPSDCRGNYHHQEHYYTHNNV